MRKTIKPRGSKDMFFHIRYGGYSIVHAHRDFWEFMFVFSGDILHEINGRKIVVPQDSLCVVRPNDVHSTHALNNQKVNYVNLGVTAQFLRDFLALFDPDLYDDLLARPVIMVQFSPAKSREIMTLANTILLQKKSTDERMLKLLFLLLVHEVIYPVSSTAPSHYGKATTEFLRLLDNPENLSLRLDTLFSIINYSYSHMNRVFLQEIGMTPSDYFKQRKIEYVKILLTDSDFSMSAIGEAIGYKSAAHFSTAFKKATGQTPSEYKASHMNLYSIEEIDTAT